MKMDCKTCTPMSILQNTVNAATLEIKTMEERLNKSLGKYQEFAQQGTEKVLDKDEATFQTDAQSSETQTGRIDNKMSDMVIVKQFCIRMNNIMKQSSTLLLNAVTIMKSMEKVQKELVVELKNYRLQLNSQSEKLDKLAPKLDELNKCDKFQVNDNKCNNNFNDEMKHKIACLVRQELNNLGVNNQMRQNDEKNFIVNEVKKAIEFEIISKDANTQRDYKLNKVERCETNLTSVMLRKQLYNLQYIPGKESPSDFCEKFENIIRNYENISGATPFSEEEKRDVFYHATMTNVPEVQKIEVMAKHMTGKGLDYGELKMFLIQTEANKKRMNSPLRREQALVTKRDSKVRCFECDDLGHFSYDCPRMGTGLKKCYECNQFTTHKAGQCPQKIERQKKRGVSRGRGFTRENNRYEYVKNSRCNKKFNDGPLPQKRKNDKAKDNNLKKPKLDFKKSRDN